MLKLLAVLLLISVAAAGPAKPSQAAKDAIQKLKMQQTMHEALYLREHPSHSRFYRGRPMNAVEKPTVADDIESFRLPNNTMPNHYDLRLTTAIHTGDTAFQGVVRINISILENTNSITLHSRQHTIQSIHLFNRDGSDFDMNLAHTAHSLFEFLIISTTQQLVVGQEFILEVTFAGVLEEFGDRGFIRSSYIHPETNASVWLAASHFQPINARHAFPCYDEIRYRTTFDLEINHHPSYNAVSNMPVLAIGVSEDSQTTIFHTTPVIPTFILAFAVTNFDSVRTERPNPPLEWSVLARPEAIAAGEADNALELARIMTEETERYFGMSYTLPKSDQIAMPQLASDGANNWGLLSFRETITLQHETADAWDQHIREMRMAHEYAHIFFANLVTPISWSFLWLNEGFATLYENVLNDIVFPEKNQWERFLTDYLDVSLSVDIFDFVPSMNQHVESNDQIRAKFNFIAYQKAALVLRMFQEAFTESTWQRGVSYYLTNMQFLSASPDDLFVGLQQALDEDFPFLGLNISNVMNPWLNLAGFPVVTVGRNAEGITLTQEGFRTIHDELYSIPLNYATASVPNFDNTMADFWLTDRQMLILPGNAPKPWTDDDWIIFNLRDTGYYVTNYDDTLWRLITDVMMTDHEAIHFLNRGTLFADMHRFIVENFDLRATVYLDLVLSLQLETHSHVWVRSGPGLLKFENRLRGSRLHQLYLDFLRGVMTPLYNVITFDDSRATNIVNSWSCRSGVQDCLTDSLNTLVEVMETGSTTFEFDYLCNGFMTANETVWMHFYSLFLDDQFNFSMADGLACTRNPELLRFYLDQAIDMTNGLHAPVRASIINVVISAHPVSTNVAIEFIQENHEVIDQIWPIEAFIARLSGDVTNTACQAEVVLDLVQFIPLTRNLGRDYFRSIMEPNLEFNDRNSDDFHVWFESLA